MKFKNLRLLIPIIGFMFLIGCGSAESPDSLSSSSQSGAATQASSAAAEAAPKANAEPGEAQNNAQKARNFIKFPKTYNWVNDFADMIADSEENAISEKIKAYEKATTNEIAIVTVETIKPDDDIVEYTRGLGNYWGVGKKAVDNGVVILLDKESRKIRIASGLGLKNEMPDKICQSIIDKQLTPEFEKGNFAAGLNNAVDRIIAILPNLKTK